MILRKNMMKEFLFNISVINMIYNEVHEFQDYTFQILYVKKLYFPIYVILYLKCRRFLKSLYFYVINIFLCNTSCTIGVHISCNLCVLFRKFLFRIERNSTSRVEHCRIRTKKTT